MHSFQFQEHTEWFLPKTQNLIKNTSLPKEFFENRNFVTLTHTNEAGTSLACYQSTLISGTSFFSQWYFPSSGRSTNENLSGMVASSPYRCPSRLCLSLARSREACFTRPNRRACSQAMMKDFD